MNKRPSTRRPRSILFLCTSNVCRGPMAAALFERHRPVNCGCIVRSAGIEGIDGLPTLTVAKEVVHKRGMDLFGHRARTATPHLFPAFDLILGMESRQCDWVISQVPAAQSRTWLLGHWRGLEIRRPTNGHHQDYDRLSHEIEQCLDDWVRRLLAQESAGRAQDFHSVTEFQSGY